MNLVQMLCCVLVARTSELGQNYLVDKVNGLRNRRLVKNDATAADANRFIDSAIQELTLSGSDFCRCELAQSDKLPSPTVATEATTATTATDRRLSWRDYMARRRG